MTYQILLFFTCPHICKRSNEDLSLEDTGYSTCKLRHELIKAPWELTEARRPQFRGGDHCLSPLAGLYLPELLMVDRSMVPKDRDISLKFI